MKRLLGALKWIAIGLVPLAIAALIWEPITATKMAPPKLVNYDARIVRDDYGVPHIFGTTDADAAYGLAYAHSEDDFETLQQVVAMTRGREIGRAHV